MPTYYFKAIDENGKEVLGSVGAKNTVDAAKQLRAAGRSSIETAATPFQKSEPKKPTSMERLRERLDEFETEKKENEKKPSALKSIFSGLMLLCGIVAIAGMIWYLGLKPNYDKAKFEERQAVALEQIHEVLKQLATNPPKGVR